MNMNWPFSDPENTAVFTSAKIIDGKDWVYYVTHDQEDSAWQFHPYNGTTPESEAKLISLKTMLTIEPRIAELADLPLGWHAWRQNQESEWERASQDD